MAESGPAVESPNWVLVLVCVVVSFTALWEAIAAGRLVRQPAGAAPAPAWQPWLDLAGYLALSLSGALFAIQAAVTPRRPETADRLQTPAVYLSVAGVFLLLLSQSGGRRL